MTSWTLMGLEIKGSPWSEGIIHRNMDFRWAKETSTKFAEVKIFQGPLWELVPCFQQLSAQNSGDYVPNTSPLRTTSQGLPGCKNLSWIHSVLWVMFYKQITGYIQKPLEWNKADSACITRSVCRLTLPLRSVFSAVGFTFPSSPFSLVSVVWDF